MSITFDFLAVLREWPLLLKGVAWTLGLTLIATVIGVGVGITCAWVRSQSGRAPGWLKWLVGSYVELIRNTPFIVQLFFIFFGLPAMGVKLSPEVASIIAMVMNLGAYSTEIFRAGIDATPKGQFEASRSLGMTGPQTMFYVIIPQTIRRVIPTMTSEFILLYKDTSLLAAVGVMELMLYSRSIVSLTPQATKPASRVSVSE